MRYVLRVLVVGVVLAMMGMGPVPAGARPECPGHPSCKPPVTTTTTAPAQPGQCGGIPVTDDDRSFDVTLTGSEWMGCTDVMWPAASWTVRVVAVAGSVNKLTVSVRDAIPGDWCVVEQFKRPSVGVLTDWSIPAATVNACGEIPGQFADGDPALAFMASFQGGQDATVTVEVERADSAGS